MNPGKQHSIYIGSQQTWSLNLLFQDSNFADGSFLGFGGQPSWKVFHGEWLLGRKKSLEKPYPIEDRTLWWWNEQGSSFQLCYKLEEKMVLHTSPHLLHPISLNLLLILILLQQKPKQTQRTSNPFNLTHVMLQQTQLWRFRELCITPLDTLWWQSKSTHSPLHPWELALCKLTPLSILIPCFPGACSSCSCY